MSTGLKIPVTAPSERAILTAARQEALEACASWLRAHSIAKENRDTASAEFDLQRAEQSAAIADDNLRQINRLPV